MALTITIKGKGVIANCDALTDTGGTGTGTWTEQGGGTISISTDSFKYGTKSIGGQYATKTGLQQFDLGAGNTLNFTAGSGSESGQFLYIWIMVSAVGTLNTLANYPLCIRFSSSSPGTTNYIDYLIASSNDSNGWDGSWRCFVIDPTLTPSRLNGTQSSIIASVRTIGLWIDTTSSARADSFFIDQMAVGSGLKITGTSTTGWKDAVDYCTAYASRAWGMFQNREGVYYAYGNIYIGDATSQSAAVSFTDSGRVIQFGISQYYQGGAWRTSIPVGASGVIIEDKSTYTTTFVDGYIVGTDGGRSGSLFLGNSLMNVSFDLYGGNNANSVTSLYNTTFKGCTGTINMGNDSGHVFYGGVVDGCGQFDPVGAPIIRNITFSKTADNSSDGATLLWNSNIDIKDCNFIANTDVTNNPHAIEHQAIGTFTYYNLQFSGNDYDIDNNSGGAIIINNSTTSKGTSNASTYENTTGNSTTIQGSVAIKITGVTEGARCRIEDASTKTAYLSKEANASGEAEESYTGTTPKAVIVKVRLLGYLPFILSTSIGTSGLTVSAVWIKDTIVD